MAKQMMEDSLTWAGCDVNRAGGEGGHNQKQSSQTFPYVLRWLLRNWPTTLKIKANPKASKGESKCRGHEEVEKGEWEKESLDEAYALGVRVEGQVLPSSEHNGGTIRLTGAGLKSFQECI